MSVSLYVLLVSYLIDTYTLIVMFGILKGVESAGGG